MHQPQSNVGAETCIFFLKKYFGKFIMFAVA
jgi:hypothetical protein